MGSDASPFPSFAVLYIYVWLVPWMRNRNVMKASVLTQDNANTEKRRYTFVALVGFKSAIAEQYTAIDCTVE